MSAFFPQDTAFSLKRRSIRSRPTSLHIIKERWGGGGEDGDSQGWGVEWGEALKIPGNQTTPGEERSRGGHGVSGK